jgi:hypothetical protein
MKRDYATFLLALALLRALLVLPLGLWGGGERRVN